MRKRWYKMLKNVHSHPQTWVNQGVNTALFSSKYGISFPKYYTLRLTPIFEFQYMVQDCRFTIRVLPVPRIMINRYGYAWGPLNSPYVEILLGDMTIWTVSPRATRILSDLEVGRVEVYDKWDDHFIDVERRPHAILSTTEMMPYAGGIHGRW